MKPGKLDLPTIWRGCDYAAITFIWKNQDGTPFDLTGWTPFAQSLNINLKPLVTDAPNGVTQIALSRIDTENLRLGTESWDWIFQNIDGTTLPPLLAGQVTIKEPTTQAFVPP